ncbi:Phosphatidylethanolamine N-methyltransferase [Pelomyxa schiedti]|nr:Phosphatidylethanolamine N-methyltransferase [Pelomyxa schiedti]
MDKGKEGDDGAVVDDGSGGDASAHNFPAPATSQSPVNDSDKMLLSPCRKRKKGDPARKGDIEVVPFPRVTNMTCETPPILEGNTCSTAGEVAADSSTQDPIPPSTDDDSSDSDEDEQLCRTPLNSNTHSPQSPESSDSEASTNKPQEGVTDSGQKFRVPHTKSPLPLYSPLRWTLFDWLKSSCLLSVILLFLPLPRWVLIVWFGIWRLAYNLGIGLLLKYQSENKVITKFTQQILSKPNNMLYSIAKTAAHVDVDNDYSFESAPPSLTAWLLFRPVVDVILFYDVVAYFVFVLGYWTAPAHFFSLKTLLSYIGGVFLCFFALWAKTDSFRVVKDYAWYWGDFFFAIHQKLTFDRVFRIAPHPMYTIGYAFFYGFALLTHSYIVLYVSLAAHVCQLVFLALVETPHMKKIYPEMVGDSSYKFSGGALPRSLVGFGNFTPYRGVDLLFMVFVAQNIVVHIVLIESIPTWVFVCEVLFWRLWLSGVLGLVLHLQSKSNWFVLKCEKMGMNTAQAFDNWKLIYNAAHVMTYVSFFCCAVKYSAGVTFQPYCVAQVLALVLCSISLWCSLSTYEVLGDYGWFYGDFFITSAVPVPVVYSGIYRFTIQFSPR